MQESDAKKLLSRWLKDGHAKRGTNATSHALREAETACDREHRDLDRRLKERMALSKSDDSGRARELRDEFNGARKHRPGDTPAATALGCLIATTGQKAKMLEDTLAELGIPEPGNPESSRRMAEAHRKKLLEGNRPKPAKKEPAETGKPLPARTLERVARNYAKELRQAMRKSLQYNGDEDATWEDEWEHEMELEIKHGYREPDSGVRPAMKMDSETLRKTLGIKDPDRPVTEEFAILLLGPEGDEAEQAARKRISKEIIEEHRISEYATISSHVTSIKHGITGVYSWADKYHPKRLYPVPYLELVHSWQEPGPIPEEWLLAANGEPGRLARRNLRRKTVQEASRKEEQREKLTLDLDAHAIRERRIGREYKGPPMRWPIAELQALWESRHQGIPMPRRWWKLAEKDNDQNISDAIDRELHAREHYHAHLKLLQTVIEKGKPQDVITRKQQLLAGWREQLQRAQAETKRLMEQAGIDPAPKPEQWQGAEQDTTEILLGRSTAWP